MLNDRMTIIKPLLPVLGKC